MRGNQGNSLVINILFRNVRDEDKNPLFLYREKWRKGVKISGFESFFRTVYRVKKLPIML